MNKYAVMYKMYGIPLNYASITWGDVDMVKPEAERLQNIFANELPSSSVLYVQGTAAPIIRQLVDRGVKVRGVDISTRLQSPFETYDNPLCNVALVYGVENPVGNGKISKKIIDDVIAFYKGIGAVTILVSKDTVTVFEANYGLKLVNKLKIPEKQEVKFV